MFTKKTINAKPNISEFNLNQADMIMGNMQRTTSNTTFTTNNKQADLYSYVVSHMVTSQGQQNIQNQRQSESNFTYRQSTKGDFEFQKRKTNLNINDNIRNPFLNNQTQNKNRDTALQTLSKKFQGFETVFHEVKHNLEEVDKRTSNQHRKLAKDFDEIKTEIERTFQKIVYRLKEKLVTMSSSIDTLRSDVSILKDGGGVDHLAMMQPKQLEKEIVYGLDVKSSIDGLKFRNEPEPKSAQMNDMIGQIETLKKQINNINRTNTSQQQSNKFKQEYEQLKNEFQSMSVILSSRTEEKINDCERILKAHDQNIQKINQQFQKVINDQISPRILHIEDNIRFIPQTINRYDSLKKTIEDFASIKNNLENKLKNSEVLHVRKATLNQSDVLQKAQNLNMHQTYYIDQDKYLLDCKANFILDENNKRIKIEDQYIYFMNLHGITTMNIE